MYRNTDFRVVSRLFLNVFKSRILFSVIIKFVFYFYLFNFLLLYLLVDLLLVLRKYWSINEVIVILLNCWVRR